MAAASTSPAMAPGEEGVNDANASATGSLTGSATARIANAGVDARNASIQGSLGASGTGSSCAGEPSGVKYAGVGYDGGISDAGNASTARGVTDRVGTARTDSAVGVPRQGAGTYGPTGPRADGGARPTGAFPVGGNAYGAAVER